MMAAVAVMVAMAMLRHVPMRMVPPVAVACTMAVVGAVDIMAAAVAVVRAAEAAAMRPRAAPAGRTDVNLKTDALSAEIRT